MAILQTTYPDDIPIAVKGQVATTTTTDIASYIVGDSAGIGVGLGIFQGSTAQAASLGARVNKFIGLSVRERSLRPNDADSGGDLVYPEGQHVAALQRGEMWVAVGAAVTVGGDVTIQGRTGVLSSAAAATRTANYDPDMADSNSNNPGQILIAGARWMTAQAVVGGLARVRLSGELPVA